MRRRSRDCVNFNVCSYTSSYTSSYIRVYNHCYIHHYNYNYRCAFDLNGYSKSISNPSTHDTSAHKSTIFSPHHVEAQLQLRRFLGLDGLLRSAALLSILID